jgi:hypothetical protein
MTAYQSDTIEWINSAKAGKRPYGALDAYSGNQLQFLSTVKVSDVDGKWAIQEQVEKMGHFWWRVINKSCRVRRLYIVGKICEDRIMWDPTDKKVKETSVTIFDSIGRTTPEADFFSQKDWSVGFSVISSGVERISSTVGNSFFESEFLTLYRPDPNPPAPSTGLDSVESRNMSSIIHPPTASETDVNWIETKKLLEGTDSVKMSRYVVVGDYVRFENACLNQLRQVKTSIVRACLSPSKFLENFMVWGVPGEGKTFLLTEIARCNKIDHIVINLADAKNVQSEQALRDQLSECGKATKPFLCILDEFDKRLSEQWLCPTVFDFLGCNEKSEPNTPNTVFVIVGSTMPSKDSFIAAIQSQQEIGGADLLSRIPNDVVCVPPLSAGDRLLLCLKHMVKCGKQRGLNLMRTEKLAVAYLMSQKYHRDARWIADTVSRAVSRMDTWEDELRYGHLFDSGSIDESFRNKIDDDINNLEGKYLHMEE